MQSQGFQRIGYFKKLFVLELEISCEKIITVVATIYWALSLCQASIISLHVHNNLLSYN